jgi:Xaa-Pro aminopeptidase
MRQAKTDTIIVLVADAAAMLGVSSSAVREWRRNGVLDAAEIAGRHAVTLTSIRELAAELDAHRVRARERRNLRRGAKRPHLRLVVDNT